MIQYSNSLKQRLASGENFRKIFAHGKISLYSGSPPNREGLKNLTGTLLATGILKIEPQPSGGFTFNNTELDGISYGFAGYLRLEASNLCWMNMDVSKYTKKDSLVMSSNVIAIGTTTTLCGGLIPPIKEYKKDKTMGWRDIMSTEHEASKKREQTRLLHESTKMLENELNANRKKLEKEQKMLIEAAEFELNECFNVSFKSKQADYICTKCNTLHKERIKALECCSNIKEINNPDIKRATDLFNEIKKELRYAWTLCYSDIDNYSVDMSIEDGKVVYVFTKNELKININILWLELKRVVSAVGLYRYAVAIICSAKTYEVKKGLLGK